MSFIPWSIEISLWYETFVVLRRLCSTRHIFCFSFTKLKPWSWRSCHGVGGVPSGYLIVVLIQFLMIVLTCLILACFSTLAFGMFMFALSFAEDMISNLYAINENAKVNESGTHILKQYIEFIDMHSDVIELSIRMINRMVIIEYLYIILCFFIRMVNLFSEVYQTVTLQALNTLYRQHYCYMHGNVTVSSGNS